VAIDELTYPQPVANRAGPAVGGAAPPPTGPAEIPRVRLVNFFIVLAAANQRTTRSFGPLRGPGMIRRARTISAPVAANNDLFFFPGYHTAPVEEVTIAVTSPYTHSVPWERMPVQGGDFGVATRGLTNSTGLTQKVDWSQELDIIVPLDEWYLTMTVGQHGGVVNAGWTGYVEIVEGISRAALANFL
jgi:hypothetical protein